MKTSPSLLLSIGLVFLLASACGKSSDNSDTVSQPIGVAPSPQPAPQPVPYPGPTTYGPQIQGSYGYFYVNYEFSGDGCTTGLRRFSGPTFEYVRMQLCQGLQNESMNYNCAQQARRSYFAQMCGYL